MTTGGAHETEGKSGEMTQRFERVKGQEEGMMHEDTKEMNLEEIKLEHVLKIIAIQCCCLSQFCVGG
jgi:hypothetical protein